MAILEDRGIFWWNDEAVPKTQFAPEASVGGKLIIEDDGGIRLDLDGMMPGVKHPFAILQDSGEPLVRNIQGLLNGEAGHVLLSGLIRNGGRMRTANVSNESYIALQCLVSHQAFKRDVKKKPHPLEFRSVVADLMGFESWLWLQGLKVKRSASKLSVNYNKPKDRSYLDAFGKLTLEYDLSGPSFSGQERFVSLNQVARVVITPKARMTMEQCQNYYQHLEELLVLLTSSDRNLDWPFVAIAGSKQRARLYFRRFRSDAKPPAAHECLINFPRIVDLFGSLYAALIAKREQYGPGLYLYLGTRRGVKMFVEHRFVNLIWGLEAFDRHGRGTAQPDAALTAKIARILAGVSAARDRKWLKGKLRHAAEPSLGERLFTVFAAMPLPFDLAILRRFCEDCQARRNDMSHFGGNRRKDQKYNEFMRDLDNKSDILSGLYHLHLLTLIGVPKERLDFKANTNWPLLRIERSLRAAGLLQKPSP